MPEETDLYGLIGHPVEHSRSPMIHRLFAEQCGQLMDYVLLDAAPGSFDRTVIAFGERGGRGLNVTLPYKGDAFRICTDPTVRATQARAVNTLAWTGDRLVGDNTDGQGLVVDLRENLGVELHHRRLLLVGAGGAARGAVGPLLESGPAELVIANRTTDRAVSLAREFAHGGPVRAESFENLDPSFDLIINATSASLSGHVPDLPAAVVGPGTFCYDMMYGRRPTAFLRWATAVGAAGCADGIGMLVEQAAESFLLWRHIRPETGPVLEKIRRSLS